MSHDYDSSLTCNQCGISEEWANKSGQMECRGQGGGYMRQMSFDAKAKAIVKAIEADLTDRRGLRQAWEEIDRPTQTEIRRTWIKIIKEIIDLS